MVYDNILLSPLSLLDVQQASKSIEVAKDTTTEVVILPLGNTHGVKDDVPDLAQKEAAIKPLDTAHGLSSDVPDLGQKEIAIKPVDTAQGMSGDRPDITKKEVARKPLETAEGMSPHDSIGHCSWCE